jgi:hypothetical protein
VFVVIDPKTSTAGEPQRTENLDKNATRRTAPTNVKRECAVHYKRSCAQSIGVAVPIFQLADFLIARLGSFRSVAMELNVSVQS